MKKIQQINQNQQEYKINRAKQKNKKYQQKSSSQFQYKENPKRLPEGGKCPYCGKFYKNKFDNYFYTFQIFTEMDHGMMHMFKCANQFQCIQLLLLF